MSRISRVNLSTVERFVSTDFVAAQRFSSRDLLNILRGVLGSVGIGPFSNEARGGVLSGLTVSISAALGPPTVIVGSGRCLVFDPSAADDEAADDSPYLLGEQRAGTTETIALAAPVPGVDRIDLIEGVPQYDTVTTESRDIYDNATGGFTAQNVPKRQRPGMSYIVTSATAAAGTVPFIPAFTPGRIPIAAVLVDDAAGAVRVYDLRRMIGAMQGDVRSVVSGGELWSGTKGTGVTSLTLAAMEAYINGTRVRQDAARTVTVLSRLDEGGPFVNNAWVYAYLALPEDGGYFNPVDFLMGELIISTIAPDARGRPASNFVGGVRPLSAARIGRSAIFLGSVFLVDAVTGELRPFYRMSNGWVSYRLLPGELFGIAPPLGAADTIDLSTAVAGVPLVPVTAEMVSMIVQYSGAGADNSVSSYTPGAAADPGGGWYDSIAYNIAGADSQSHKLMLPITSRQLHVERSGPAITTAETYHVIGYYEPRRNA